MRLWYFPSSENSFFRRALASSQWGLMSEFWPDTLLPYFMCTNSEGSGETVQMCRLVWAFAGCLCDYYHNLMSWLKGLIYSRNKTPADPTDVVIVTEKTCGSNGCAGWSAALLFTYMPSTTDLFKVFVLSLQLRSTPSRWNRCSYYNRENHRPVYLFKKVGQDQIIITSLYLRAKEKSISSAISILILAIVHLFIKCVFMYYQ